MPARSAPIYSIYTICLRERYFEVVMRTAAVKPRDRPETGDRETSIQAETIVRLSGKRLER